MSLSSSDEAVHTLGSRTPLHNGRVFVVEVVVVVVIVVMVLLVEVETVVDVKVDVGCVCVTRTVGHVEQRLGQFRANSAIAMPDAHTRVSFPHQKSSGLPSHEVLQTPHMFGHRSLISLPTASFSQNSVTSVRPRSARSTHNSSASTGVSHNGFVVDVAVVDVSVVVEVVEHIRAPLVALSSEANGERTFVKKH